MKKIFILTLFPEYFEALKSAGVVGRALEGDKSQVETILINPRDFSTNNYKGVDDTPFGGGPGMVMRADIMAAAINDGICKPNNLSTDQLHIIYTAPRGKVWCDKLAQEQAKYFSDENPKHLVYICGRYEGVDERFLQHYVDEFICLGDFVLSGGEIAVMAIIDSSMRFVKGVLGNDSSAQEDSFTSGLIEHAQYTKPREFEGSQVPEVLLSGHHKKIGEFQKDNSLEMTKNFRPDLFDKYIKSNPVKDKKRK